MILASQNPNSCSPAAPGGSAATINECDLRFTAAGGAESFSVPANLKNIAVFVNEGRRLQKSDAEFTYSGTTVSIAEGEVESGDVIYISGIYQS